MYNDGFMSSALRSVTRYHYLHYCYIKHENPSRVARAPGASHWE